MPVPVVGAPFLGESSASRDQKRISRRPDTRNRLFEDCPARRAPPAFSPPTFYQFPSCCKGRLQKVSRTPAPTRKAAVQRKREFRTSHLQIVPRHDPKVL